MNTTRREFMKSASIASLGFTGLGTLFKQTANAAVKADKMASPFGPLISDGQDILELPAGFKCEIISKVGNVMEDGFLVPGGPDGMAAFQGPGSRTILVCNHELNPSHVKIGAFGKDLELKDRLDASKFYDAGKSGLPAMGGTTTMVHNTATGKLERQWLSLAGTVRNCAGGPTPWGSWITCEETDDRADNMYAKDHGYNFEVPAAMDAPIADPIPLIEMGRMRHEAVAVHEATSIVYQTEDIDDSCIYRYIPNVPGDLKKGGKLQALVVRSNAKLDTRNWGDGPEIPRNLRLATRWVDLQEPESPNNDLRHQAQDKGAALFARGEGMWAGNNEFYFACTSGGKAKKGQIWRYIPSPYEGTPEEEQSPGALELFVEPNDSRLINNADNLTVAPWGDLILCEDTGDSHLVGVTPEGEIYKFAHNIYAETEMAGSCFSPDGTTLYVNIQGAGVTLAITGPWRKAYI